MKKYKITFAPTVKIEQEVVNPYNDWDSENVKGPYFYTPIHNHDRSYTESIEVEASSKETAKAAFAIEIYLRVPFGRPVRGGYKPLVFDAIRNIKSIEEITEAKSNE